MAPQERVVYLNGEIVPESKASISIRDRGFVYGDAVFDTARTFNGQVFKLKEHIDRLYDSCKYVRLEPGMDKERMTELTLEVLERNVPLLPPGMDYWVTQRVTRGVEPQPGQKGHPTVLIECRHLPLAKRAHYYRDGIPMLTSTHRRIPPWAMSPQAKTHNYLNVVLAELEVKDRDPEAWAMLLDERGNLAEGSSYNVFVIRDGVVSTPRAQFSLAGVSRQTVLDLARGLNIPTVEQDVDMYEAYLADEMFLTSTSLCICPVVSLNGIVIGDGKVPGPLTARLMGAFTDLVGMDYVAQYLAHLRPGY